MLAPEDIRQFFKGLISSHGPSLIYEPAVVY
jgi:hypothetical protein